MTSILDSLFGSPTVGTPPYLPPGAIAPGMAPGVMAPSIFDPQAIDRQRTQDLLMGLANGFLKAGQPSRVPIDIGSALGQGIEGGLQAVQGSDQRSIQRAMMDAQIRNYQMQSALFPAALKSLGQTSTYDPYGGKAQPQPQPQITTQPLPAVAQTKADESGGNYTATNPTSGAYGAFQFTAPTWASVVQAHPELNLPLNMRQATPQQQDAAKAALDQDNGKGLQAAGIAPTAPNLYLAHRFGVQGTQTFLSAPDDAPVSSVLPADWIQQNPDLQGVTVGQFKAGVAQRYGGMPGAGPRADQGNGLPPIPIQPPDPSKYNSLRLLGGQWAKMADALAARDQQRYQAAKDLYTLSLQGQTAKREGANAAVNPDGSVNQSVVAAATAKKTGEEEATEKARQQAVFGGPGWEKLTPDQLRARANPEALSLVDQVQSGQTPMSTISTKMGSGGIAVTKNDVLALGKKLYGDEWDPNGGDRRQKFEADTTDTSSQTGKTLYSINTVYKHLDRFQTLTDAMENHNTPIVNEVLRLANTAAGYAKYTTPEALQHALGTEIANVIKGQQLNEPEVKAAVDTLSTTQSPAQMHGALAVLRHAMGDRESTITWAARRAKVPESRITNLIDPDARAAIQHFDEGQAKFAASQPGQPATTPNGAAIPAPPAGYRVVQ